MTKSMTLIREKQNVFFTVGKLYLKENEQTELSQIKKSLEEIL
jgi:hypothetical protein